MATQLNAGSARRLLRRAGALLWRVSRGMNKATIHLLLPLFVRKAVDLRLERLGSDYGGWYVPVGLIKADWICYCVGVGIDATFDLALTKRFGCRVFSFDPTPKAIEYMAKLDYDKERLQFLPVGVWKDNTTLKFFEPANQMERSNLSIYDLHGTGRYVSAECRRLSSLMSQLGHDRINLLKLDVEGAWLPNIDSMIEDGIRVDVFCVELDSPVTFRRVLRVLRKAKELGLVLAHFEKDNYLFVREGSTYESPWRADSTQGRFEKAGAEA